jgi:hypothetical protein
MAPQIVDVIARTVPYEGLLYPYRATALTPQPHLARGVVWPPGVNDGAASQIETQWLVRAPGSANLEVEVRFLHLATHHGDGTDWDEASERVVTLQVNLGDGCKRPVRESFRWPGYHTASRSQESLRGDVELLVEPVGMDEAFFKLTVVVANTTGPLRTRLDQASVLRHALVSPHVLVQRVTGAFGGTEIDEMPRLRVPRPRGARSDSPTCMP